MCILYATPPHWHDTGSWIPSSSKTRTYLFYIVNIIDADVLTTQGASASATMILTLMKRNNSVSACLRLTFTCSVFLHIYIILRFLFLSWLWRCFLPQGASQWRHNKRDGVLNHRRLDCLHNRLFRRRSKKTSKVRVTGLCEGNSPVVGGFPSQRAGNAEKCFHLMTLSCECLALLPSTWLDHIWINSCRDIYIYINIYIYNIYISGSYRKLSCDDMHWQQGKCRVCSWQLWQYFNSCRDYDFATNICSIIWI